jgi:ribosomal-protein-alanine N-acetyltransferase
MSIQQACKDSVAEWPPGAYRGEGGYETLVAVEASQVAGFLLFRGVADEMEILNLAVSPRRRRAGIGSALLVAALAGAAGRGARSVFLEVRESNSVATAFYERLGFAQCGRRPRYYSSPEEDGVVLSRPVGTDGGRKSEGSE